MEEQLASRLLGSIDTDRLAIFCGAGLSMASPSTVPSAYELAQRCSAYYEQITGSAIPREIQDNLLTLAEFFYSQGNLRSLFIRRLIPWPLFKIKPNPGHNAIADFLSCGAIEFCITTNVDSLVEVAADSLGQNSFWSSIDGNEANYSNPNHRPFLKIHGCCNRDMDNTLWCPPQLNEATLRDRIASLKRWLGGYLLNRDLVFIGFWSDWAYLNSVLEDCLGSVDPSFVVVVDPCDDRELERKAPGLWAWVTSRQVRFVHVQESGAAFLDDLRRRFSRRFLHRLAEDSKPIYRDMTGSAIDPNTILFNQDLSSEELYGLRMDFSGRKDGPVPKHKRPDSNMHRLGAAHLLLMAHGAVMEGATYKIAGKRIRLVHGAGELLSSVKSRYSAEAPLPVAVDIVICAGAFDDGGIPTHIVREQDGANIIRGGISGDWLTLEQARQQIGI